MSPTTARAATALLDGLSQGDQGAGSRDRNHVSSHRRDVYQATNGQQSPELSISLVPEYYLNQSETDQTIWARIRTSADAATSVNFSPRYPNSFYAPDAMRGSI